MRGQIVKGVDVVTNNNDNLQIDISSLSPGYYLLKVVCIRSNELVYPVFKILVQ